MQVGHFVQNNQAEIAAQKRRRLPVETLDIGEDPSNDRVVRSVYSSLEDRVVPGLKAMVKDVSVRPTSASAHTFKDAIFQGMEISGQALTGIPGAVVSFVVQDDGLKALLREPGQSRELEAKESLDQDRKPRFNISLPDGTELQIGSTRNQHMVQVSRVENEGDKRSVSVESEVGSSGRLTQFTAASDAGDKAISIGNPTVSHPLIAVTEESSPEGGSLRRSAQSSVGGDKVRSWWEPGPSSQNRDQWGYEPSSATASSLYTMADEVLQKHQDFSVPQTAPQTIALVANQIGERDEQAQPPQTDTPVLLDTFEHFRGPSARSMFS